MGVRNSTRRQRMEDRETGESENSRGGQMEDSGSGDGEGSQHVHGQEWQNESNRDLATVLSYLIRSGQVSILTSGGASLPDDDDDDDDDYYDNDDDLELEPAASPRLDRNPDVSGITSSEFAQEILQQSGRSFSRRQNGYDKNSSVTNLLRKREVGMTNGRGFSGGNCNFISSNYLPNRSRNVDTYHEKAFCGTYSREGDIFLTACQDRNLRIYDTRYGGFRLIKKVRARDVGWSVLDTAFSPDGNYLIYSSWCDSIHMCNIYGDQVTHVSLPLNPEASRTAIFSVTFSTNSQEILGGANDGCLYIYGREQNERLLKIDAHEDDVNAVAFADMTSQILFSGADDGLVKVWDRRTLSEESPDPVGILAGHTDGITFIDTKGDARYLISNSKDQTIKLWDMRRFSSRQAQMATKKEVARQNWDYRWQQAPRRSKKKKLPGDTSLMTYRGHSVLHTLVRSRFSPAFTTGQRYIYTGSATGALIIYDVLTGEVIRKLKSHRACVRDVSWHPYEHSIMSTSWDGSIAQWTYACEDDSDMDTSSEDSPDDQQPYSTSRPRRSRRLRLRTGRGFFVLS